MRYPGRAPTWALSRRRVPSRVRSTAGRCEGIAAGNRRSPLALLLVLLAGTWSAPAPARSVTDSGGRVVEIPEQVRRVYAAGNPASILIYVLAPDRLTGWPRTPHAGERPYLAAAYRDLPQTGRLTGRGDNANLERVLSARPDLIVDFGSIRDTYISLADAVQAQTGIPYLLIDGRFENTPATLRLMAGMLGVAERGESLARYAEAVFADIDAVLETVPVAERPRVYLARGPDGLETALKRSINSEIIERAGGRNVVDPGDATRRRGIVQNSIENVILANPDTIITWDRVFYERVWDDPLWAGIEAVRRGRVYLSPIVPFGWIERPPSVNRLIGLKWLAGLFYPARLRFDLRAETRRFYKLFYHVDLGEQQLDELIAWTTGRGR